MRKQLVFSFLCAGWVIFATGCFSLPPMAEAPAAAVTVSGDPISISSTSSSARVLSNGNTEITFVAVLSLNVIPMSFNFHWGRSDGARTALRVISVNNGAQQVYRLVEKWTVGPSVAVDQLWEKVFVNSGNTHLVSNPIMAGTAQPGSSSPTGSSPPPTPTGLTVTSPILDTLTITWNAVSGATSYQLFRATAGSGSYNQVYSGTGTSYNDTNLAGGATYSYEVSATNSAGSSPLSAPAQ